MSNSAAPLIDYLRQLEARGEEYISVDDGARKILRAFYMRARSGVVASGPSSGSGKPMPDTAKRSGEVLTASNAKPQSRFATCHFANCLRFLFFCRQRRRCPDGYVQESFPGARQRKLHRDHMLKSIYAIIWDPQIGKPI